VAPREDLATLGEAAVKFGKVSRSTQQTQARRGSTCKFYGEFPCVLLQLVYATAHFFDISTYADFNPALIAVYAGVPNETVNRFGICYTVSQIAFSVCYSYIETQNMSYLRSAAWWSGNISCFAGFIAAATKL
jgi:uncharacterized MAPEG superfamily protein